MQLLRKFSTGIAVFIAGFFICAFATAEGAYIATKPASIMQRFLAPPPKNNNNFQLKFPIQASVPKAKLTIIGDSLSDYGPWNRLLKVEFNNFGVSGDTSTGVVERLQGLPLGPTVMIQFGTNDPRMGVSLKRSNANTDEALRLLKGHDVIFALTPPTSIPSVNDDLARIAAYQREACLKAPRCNVLDLAAIVGRNGMINPDLTTDGVHINYLGYSKWAEALSSMI